VDPSKIEMIVVRGKEVLVSIELELTKEPEEVIGSC
jgi:hypothetical protein